MAKKKSRRRSTRGSGMTLHYACCMGLPAIIHTVAGVGIGFVLTGYLSGADIMLWGWILIVVGVLGHLMGKTRCTHCNM